MGSSFCSQTTIELPEYSEQFASTDLPAWVSAGGKALFDQAIGLAGSVPEPSDIPKLASYDGSKLTPEEQLAAKILTEGSTSYQPFIDRASDIAGTVGQGYDAATREELLGDPFSGMTNEELMGSYSGATREELLGDPMADFSLDTAQPFLDIYQGASDRAVRELERQTLQNQIQARAQAARGGAFGGSRLGISEAMLGAEGAMGAADLRARAAAEGLGFAASRFDADRRARMDAENMLRGQFEADRASRFDTESMRRSQFDADRSARFGAEDALRAGYQADEASRLSQMQAFRDLAPLTQSLQEAAAQGLISTGEARRRLDQAALDLARAEDLDLRSQPFERLNFALGVLQGVPYEQQNFGYRMGQSTQAGPSLFGQVLGGAGALASAYYAGRN